jgi:hypothetical protein
MQKNKCSQNENKLNLPMIKEIQIATMKDHFSSMTREYILTGIIFNTRHSEN